MLVLLAVAAGCVDAVSFLGLGQVLTAAMTGNTVLLGLALGRADGLGALRSIVALLAFFAGVMLGAAIARRDPPGPIWSPVLAAALALEFVLLVGLASAWHLVAGAERWVDARFPLIAAAGLAMGIQSAVAYRIGVPGIATTYVTGTMTSLATRLVGRLRMRAARSDRVESPPTSWLSAKVWIAYGGGAVFAGAMEHWWSSVGIVGDVRWPSAALLLPMVLVAMVALTVAFEHRRRAKSER
jgi:uncharacterized membrane protein YoaK (UPF0700 family)